MNLFIDLEICFAYTKLIRRKITRRLVKKLFVLWVVFMCEVVKVILPNVLRYGRIHFK